MKTLTDHTAQHFAEASEVPSDPHEGHDMAGHGAHDAPSAARHERHSMPAGGHEGHSIGQRGHVDMFRRRFWWSLSKASYRKMIQNLAWAAATTSSPSRSLPGGTSRGPGSHSRPPSAPYS